VDYAIGVMKSHSPPTRDEGGQKRSEDADPLLMVGEKTPKIGGTGNDESAVREDSPDNTTTFGQLFVWF